MGAARRRTRQPVTEERLSKTPTWRVIKLACERLYWTNLYIECNGSMSQVAKIAGVNRQHCYRIMDRLGIAPYMKAPNDGLWNQTIAPFSDEPTKSCPRMYNPANEGSRTGKLFRRLQRAAETIYEELKPAKRHSSS
jgi:hypothetical protein